MVSTSNALNRNKQTDRRLQRIFLATAEKACCEYSVCVEPDNRPCSDAYFGTIRKLLDEPITVSRGVRKSPENRIVLALESPHIDEYKDTKKVWPIQGQSGVNFRSNIHELIPSQLHDWGVFVVNAIRYQCSQGLILSRGYNRSAKNFVVGNLLMNVDFQRDFLIRIRETLHGATNIVVLNACTQYQAWNVPVTNKERIQDLLNTVEGVSRHCFCDIPHPSCWKNKNLETTRHKLSEFLQSIGYMPKATCT